MNNKTENLKLILLRIIAGAIFGVFYMLLIPSHDTYQALLSISIGISIALCVGILNRYLMYSRLNQQPVFVIFIARLLLYFIVISLAILLAVGLIDLFDQYTIHREVTLQDAYQTAIGWLFSDHYLMLLILSITFLIILQLFSVSSMLLGRKTLFYYLMGKYYQPKLENRIFLLVDLKSSTKIAESLGNKMFYRFLKAFYRDIAYSIQQSQGEIYEYVGDEIIITWHNDDNNSLNSCFSCFFSMKKAIRGKSEYYEKRFGFVPQFRGGAHVGEILIGEIGVYKRKIIYAGDTINTASRIIDQGNKLNQELVISSDLHHQLKSIKGYRAKFLGAFLFKGKKFEMEIFAIQQQYTS